ncbi:MAG: bifunctional diaminohydroxyphosphoribosylaminopyrimidine deaminase/5-amino-6-(5-phosphoribosylamino)uracil reductase RibD [Deltaproteobacteria bacterium]|nr:bifunctional diaminohydroxyphosphoribosylaminopyrimidine deaminase/5-amino-6-(5-phosphoribosylamino)uracil reductase RibD [Deltaproteobacteria bacterium]
MTLGEHGSPRDAEYMRLALELGRRGLGRTRPNPPVGAVVVRGGRVVGSGWHRRAGTAHAEAIALEQAGAAARGATLYVTLEPCTHQGRMPPCAPRVIESGVQRVVIGAIDPNPLVSRRGVAQLRRAGVAVTTGVESAASMDLIAAFARHVVTGRPFVRLKLAASADGRIATRTGASRWITGAPARRLVHRWRNEMDAVMVGVDTVIADDPELTCRRAGGRDPVRVVVDGRLRIPPRARLLHDGRGPVWIATRTRHDRARAARLGRDGATILPVVARGPHLDLGALLVTLGRRDLTSVLVEAGAALSAALIAGGHVDELCWFSAPLLIGGDGLPMIGPLGVRSLRGAFPLSDLRVERVGDDLLHTARVEAR